jgi:hypothetical protein
MTREKMLAAIQIEYQRFLAESGLRPEQLNESDRMLWQIAFIHGSCWCQDEIYKRIRESQT